MKIINELLLGESTRSLSRKYGISKSNVERWGRQYREHGESGLDTKRKPENPYGGASNIKHVSEVDKVRYELAKAKVEIVKLKKQLELQKKEDLRRK